MESMYFIYDGINSIDMNLYVVRIDHSGFVESPYWGGVDIKEEKFKNRLTPYFYGVERENIEFTIQLMLMDENLQPKEWTPQERFKIAKWLVHDTYKEFQTSDDLGKRYNVICTNPANLNLINSQGYVELTFRTNSPFAWSPVYVDEFDLTDNATTTIIQLENRSNVIKYYKPKIEIEYPSITGFADSTDIILKNLSNGGKEFKLNDVKKGEIYSIDNENQIILSSRVINLNPLSHFNRVWLELPYGINQIQVEGKVKIWVKSQFPIAQ